MRFSVHRHPANHVICLKTLSRKFHGFSPLTPLLYAESCYFTKALQYTIEGMHSLEIPWFGTFMLSGVLFRIASLPLHVYAERLSAERCHVVNTLNHELIKSKEIILDVCWKHRLQLPRIQYLKFCALSIWTFSSFAIRNVISSETGYPFQGILWFPDLLQPDPYCIIPASVGILGIFNYFAQQRIYIYSSVKLMQIISVCYSLIMIFGIYFMSHLPVVSFFILMNIEIPDSS
ncbi:unnamed protein product [Onchocerca flexuosa]|uniref:Transmembrane protein n=1 Tax=Onchocerca flexuosa TaxID=387005 RepID=A0A183H2S7_9BILA|nr:unnamed protein product [Onchocerca flexuosa]